MERRPDRGKGNIMDRKKLAEKSIKALRELYPDAGTELAHADPFQLLVATILSAQCTDERVNAVTKNLFRKYKTPADFAEAGQEALEKEIRSTGFFRMKAKSLIESSKAIVEKFNGEVPKTMEELLQLRGVARKTANVVLGSAFGIPAGIVVDTHVKRLSFRIGLSDQADPVKIETELTGLIPRKDWIWFSHALILHGRRVCKARNPGCPGCLLRSFCPKRGV